MNSLKTIIFIILLSGFVGGIANFFRNDANSDFNMFRFIKSIIVGLVASFTVPLFLNTVSSTLLNEAENENINYLIFAGFCLIAAFSANRFMVSLTDKILNDLNEVKSKTETIEQKSEENEQRVDELIEGESDPVIEEQLSSNKSLSFDELGNPNQNAVMATLMSGTYKFRSLSGLAQESDLDGAQLKQVIENLENENLVKKIRGREGRDLYRITSMGQRIFSEKANN